MFLARVSGVVLATAAPVVLAAGPAVAGIPGVARARIDVLYRHDTNGNVYAFDVCASAAIDDGPVVASLVWSFTIDGARSSAALISEVATALNAPSFSQCRRVTSSARPAARSPLI